MPWPLEAPGWARRPPGRVRGRLGGPFSSAADEVGRDSFLRALKPDLNRTVPRFDLSLTAQAAWRATSIIFGYGRLRSFMVLINSSCTAGANVGLQLISACLDLTLTTGAVTPCSASAED